MEKKTQKNDSMEFIANELGKIKEEPNKETLHFLSKSLNNEEISKESFRESLTKKRTQISSSTKSNITIGLDASLHALDINQDLTTTIDPVLHFSQSQLGITKRIFNWQVTQNYLLALKWFVADDLVKKQSAFNAATQGAFGNMNNLINDVDQTMRKFIVDAQHDFLDKINTVEINVKRNFDRQLLFNELSLINDKFSWLKLLNLEKIAYYNDAPKTERFTEYLWILKNLINIGKLLDIGCVESIFPQEIAKQKKIEVYGIDTRNYEKPNFNFFQEDSRKMHFEDNYFDQVTVISTLEHIGLVTYDNKVLDKDGDIKTMKEIARVLKPTGTVLITMPYGKGSTTFGGQQVVHSWLTSWYRSYDKNSIQQLFADYDINEIRYFVDDGLVWIEADEEKAAIADNSKWVKGIAVIKATK